MDPLTPLDTLCRIILRAKEYEAQVPSEFDAGEEPENVDDEGEEALSVLDDDLNDGVEEELRAVIEDLGEDQQAELLAFCWVGQGTYEASDWDEAIAEATDEVAAGDVVDQFLEMPMLAGVLEAGMASFELTCEGVGDVS